MADDTEQPNTRASPLALTRRWLSANAKWLGAVGAIAAVVSLVLVFIGPSPESTGNTITLEKDNQVGIIAIGDVNVGDPVDKEIIVSQRDTIALHEQTIELLTSQLSAKEQQDNPQIREDVADAVTGIPETDSTPTQIAQAEAALADGDTQLAQALYKADAEKKAAAGEIKLQAAAESYRRLGALAFLDDTLAALDAYQRAVEVWPEDISAWNQLGLVYDRMGDLVKSEEAYNKVLLLSDSEVKWKAIAYGNIGNIYRIKGELDKAVEMHEKSLELNTEQVRKEGMASNYGNLGTVYQIQGELDQAEAMYKKALAIDVALERKKGMASHLGNLGTVYRINGDLDQAVMMFEQSLAIEVELVNKIGMAIDYGNLGIIYHMRGELDQAEAMHKKALAIDVALVRKEGIASHYGNLGMVHEERGELDQAEAMYKNALTINKALVHKVGMARDYANLGSVYEKRGESSQAIESWEKAKALFDDLDSPMKEVVQKRIDDHKIGQEIEQELDED